MGRIVWVLLGCLALIPSVQAASFDCNKASTSVEKLICSNPKLDTLDYTLGQVYRIVLGKPAPGSHPALETGQREWLSQTRNKCSTEACLGDAYTSRITQLFLARDPAPSPNERLAVAAQSGDVTEAAAALKAGASVQVPVAIFWPRPILPLVTAVTFRNIEVIKLLLSAGADPSSALYTARCPAPDVFQELLEHGANPNVQQGTYPPVLAGTVIAGDAKVVDGCLQSAKLLIKYGAKVNEVRNGTSPLSAAVQVNATPFVELFLSNGADVNKVSWADLTALQLAVDRYARDPACDHGGGTCAPFAMIRLLLEHGANPNIPAPGPWRDDFADRYPYIDGSTPLCLAAVYGWPDVAKLLLEHGAKPSIPRSDGALPLTLAQDNHHADVAALIESFQAKDGKTQ